MESTDMERASFYLVLILLFSSSLIAPLAALPLPTGSQTQFHEVKGLQSLGDTLHQAVPEESNPNEQFVGGRMELTSNHDYSGAVPNGKHTPTRPWPPPP